MKAGSYEEVKKVRDLNIHEYIHDSLSLNRFHDEIMQQIILVALEKVAKETGNLSPSPFSFFVMGSAGRFEQGVWSDQDHGIIYEETNEHAKKYFLRLGNEISKGLYLAGYHYCLGGVMASNPFWCKSFEEWQQQINNWIQDQSWESIRNLLIFMDSRTIYGEEHYLHKVKEFTLTAIENNKILPQIFNNTIYYKKGIGVFGQFLTETHGNYSRQLNVKETALIPYVNAFRFLAIKEKITDTSTLSRIRSISEEILPQGEKEKYMHHFSNLLKYRLLYGNQLSYESSHYLNISHLSKEQRKELKEIMKLVASLYSLLKRVTQKDGSYGNE